jgi:hypothetical protein
MTEVALNSWESIGEEGTEGTPMACSIAVLLGFEH